MAAPADGRDAWIAASDEELVRQCDVDRYRASGAGGQHRNKTESAVRLRHRASGVIVHADDSRQQGENKARATKRLRAALALEIRLPIDLATWAPSTRLAKMVAGGTAPLGERTRQSIEFYLGIAELLDLFVACEVEVAATGERLGIGSAATSRLLLVDDRLARTVNELRGQRGMRLLR